VQVGGQEFASVSGKQPRLGIAGTFGEEPLACSLGGVSIDVGQLHLVSVQREYLGDPAAHVAGADNCATNGFRPIEGGHDLCSAHCATFLNYRMV
jgi:hypothetical protein